MSNVCCNLHLTGSGLLEIKQDRLINEEQSKSEGNKDVLGDPYDTKSRRNKDVLVGPDDTWIKSRQVHVTMRKHTAY